ncbi:MAG: AAA family ATPase [Deltaproteobacteria bacterium]|nr:AAA family ATPase [Deltaproteobacteria bacterium]
MLIEGAPGIGKTYFTEKRIKVEAKERGALILRSKCSLYENIKYNAIDGLIDELMQYIKKTGYDLENIYGSIDQIVFNGFYNKDSYEKKSRLSTIVDILNFINEIRPIVIFIDNFQWSDSESITFIAELIWRSNGFMFMLNFRKGENETSLSLRKRIQYRSNNLIVKKIKLRPFNKKKAGRVADFFLFNSLNKNQVVMESSGIPYFVNVLSKFVNYLGTSKTNNLLSGFIYATLKELPIEARLIVEFAAVKGQSLGYLQTLKTLDIKKNKENLIRVLIKKRLLKHTIKKSISEFRIYNKLIKECILDSMTIEAKNYYGNL